MIYFIKPLLYQTSLKNMMFQIIKENFTNSTIQIINDIYFIIHDTNLSSWNGLEIAKTIRKYDKHSHIILVTNSLDYTLFFRSHVNFFDIIKMDNLEYCTIKQILNDSINLQQ